MGIIVLLVIGAVIWWIFSGNSSEPTHIKQQRQKKTDKEFEEMFFSGASGDDIDDF